jgi:hypothetical protein
VKGEKILGTKVLNEKLVRLAIYLLPDKNGKLIIITCGSPGSDGERYDEFYDRTVGTFEWN